MTEERLKEIKDSMPRQLFSIENVHLDGKIIGEKWELYNEVIRLREIIKKTNKYLDKLIQFGIRNEDIDLKELSLLLNDEKYVDITTQKLHYSMDDQVDY